MGETMFKEAKNVDAFTQSVAEFAEAARLAPQWPEARYNLALAKEAAGDYSGSMADLKLYKQFKLTDSEARTAQDKIYAIEAKQKMAANAANTQAEQTPKEMAAPFSLICVIDQSNQIDPTIVDLDEREGSATIHFGKYSTYGGTPPVVQGSTRGPFAAKFDEGTVSFVDDSNPHRTIGYTISRQTWSVRQTESPSSGFVFPRWSCRKK